MYERIWSLLDASVRTLVSIETLLKNGEIEGPERFEELADELVICVLSFSMYRLRDDNLFLLKPTETILKAAAVRRHSLRSSDERALRFVLQQAKLLRRVARGEVITPLRLERLLAFTLALFKACSLEWEGERRVRGRRRRSFV